jgi:5-methylcytosine-specific restriction endonuclease McrA
VGDEMNLKNRNNGNKNEINTLDAQAIKVARNYKKLEQELLALIIEIDKKKIFYQLGYNSLFSYLTDRLELTPAATYAFINVARKSHEIPELKEHVTSGKLSIYKAQRITPVITSKNSKTWLTLAQSVTHRKLEREVALAAPRQAVLEKTKYLSLDQELSEKVVIKRESPRLALQMGVSEKLMLKIRRAQDLESQRNKKSLSLEETLEQILDVYLDKRDPLKRAQRQLVNGKIQMSNSKKDYSDRRASVREGGKDPDSKKSLIEEPKKRPMKKQLLSEKTETSYASVTSGRNFARAKSDKRKPIPASIYHQLQLRDQGQCTHRDQGGRRCPSRRFLEAHHIKPVSNGGDNSLENLTLFCSGHHKSMHQMT